MVWCGVKSVLHVVSTVPSRASSTPCELESDVKAVHGSVRRSAYLHVRAPESIQLSDLCNIAACWCGHCRSASRWLRASCTSTWRTALPASSPRHGRATCTCCPQLPGSFWSASTRMTAPSRACSGARGCGLLASAARRWRCWPHAAVTSVCGCGVRLPDSTHSFWWVIATCSRHKRVRLWHALAELWSETGPCMLAALSSS